MCRRQGRCHSEAVAGDSDRPARPRWCYATTGREAARVVTVRGGERQFCAPGFDLPFGAFSRSPAEAFPEYHSSDDDLRRHARTLADSYRTLLSIIDGFERDTTYVNASPYGEPQLGRRGLYRSIGGSSRAATCGC